MSYNNGKTRKDETPNLMVSDERGDKSEVNPDAGFPVKKTNSVNLNRGSLIPGREAKTSHLSIGSSVTQADSKSREFVESPFEKTMEIKSLLFALLCNILLLAFILQVSSPDGMLLSSTGNLFGNVATVDAWAHILLQLWMHVGHSFTGYGITEASSLIFGHLLSEKNGFSLAVCGFAHSSYLRKLTFTNFLPYKSKSKPFLNKLTLLWMFHGAWLILTVFSSIFIKAKVRRIDSGELSCVVYHENGNITDRMFPDLDSTMGSGEYVFGTSMGHMRSQEPVPVTTHAFPPQLIDMFVDGTTIVGNGVTTDIFTECQCSRSFSDEDVIDAGIPAHLVSPIKQRLTNLGKDLGMVNYIELIDEQEMKITTAFNYRYSCGGTAISSNPIQVCNTRFFNHTIAEIVGSYMSDGSTSSVALKFVVIRNILGQGNMKWPYQSLVNLLGGNLTSHVLPESIPGSISTLLWWTTVNLQFISPSFMSVGVETMWAQMLRVGFQRTLSFDQTKCLQNVPDPSSTVLHMSEFGMIFGVIYVSGQLLVNIISLILTIPRFLEKNPITPAIRICRDYTYFLLLVNGSFTAGILSECKSSVHVDDVWVKMDINVRVGETIGTKEDPEKGSVTIDRPKFVTNLVRGKRYA